jgi:peptidoglycan-associated lipoprotein
MKKLIVLVLAGFLVFGCSTSKTSSKPGDADYDSTKAGDMKGGDGQDVKDTGYGKVDSTDMGNGPEMASKYKVDDVHFDYDRYDIKSGETFILREAANILRDNPSLRLIIEGHCDDRGTNEYNLALGDRRAKSVKDHLVSLGIPSSRLQTISYGEEKPMCSEQTESCWASNRRAHLSFVK